MEIASLKLSLETLFMHKEYMDWKVKHPNSYLVHAFIMTETTAQSYWQIGFYNENNTITSFAVEGDNVSLGEEDAIFKKTDKAVPLLDQDRLTLDSKEILAKAELFFSQNYSAQQISKTIILVQTLPLGQVYNITFLCKSLQTVSIKVDTATGEILQHELRSLMDFREE